MKKWLAFLLLLITMAGSLIPCCEVDNCDADQTFVQQNDPNPNGGEGGSCSPFYSCQTCTGFTQLAKPVVVPEPIVEASIHHAETYTLRINSFAASFWQPPRLG